MEEYAQAMAYNRATPAAGSLLGADKVAQSKPRLASLIDRLSGLNEQTFEIAVTAAGELDRIMGTPPVNADGLPGASNNPVNCAVAEIDGLVDDLSSKLSQIRREVERLRGL